MGGHTSPIKSVKYSGGGVIKYVNKYAAHDILSRFFVKAKEALVRQPKQCVTYLYIHRQELFLHSFLLLVCLIWERCCLIL